MIHSAQSASIEGAAAPSVGAAPPATRLQSLDAARGFALLGIFAVNAAFFAKPIGDVLAQTVPDGISAAEQGIWYFVHIFCMGKFYPLFSLMFGYGLTLQMERRRKAGRGIAGVGVRRLLFLAAVGLCHALLIWHGDILFLYGMLGLLLLPFTGCKARTLAIVAVVFFAISALTGAGMGLLDSMKPPPAEASSSSSEVLSATDLPADDALKDSSVATNVPAATTELVTTPTTPTSPTSPVSEPTSSPAASSTIPSVSAASPSLPSPSTPSSRLFEGFESGTVQDPAHLIWRENEIIAMRDGPYAEALIFRSLSWVMLIVVSLVHIGWHIFAMFCLGALLAKISFLGERWTATRWSVGVLGLPLALLLSGILTVLTNSEPGAMGKVGIFAINPIVWSLTSLGYLCLVSVVVAKFRRFGNALANVGRMAFTNYLMQSIIATGLMYHWGLGLFGSVGYVWLAVMVVVIYALQVVLSNLWLSYFQFGPLEWVWRSVTYLRLPLMRRGAGSGARAGSTE